ncbi:MAG: two-component system NtrC family sensor kinase [Nitrospirae bacterium]|nr:MAG: two-component system NtrC family sensor kinase [Nitrospirota bacterium]
MYNKDMGNQQNAKSGNTPQSNSGSHKQDNPHTAIEIFSNMIRTVHDTIITVNSEKVIIFCNGSVQKIFGYTPDELQGVSISSIMPEQYQKTHLEALETTYAADNFKIIWEYVEFTGLKKDRTEFPAELSLSTWLLDGRRYFTYLISDITGRKMAMEELVRSNEELSRKHEELSLFFKKIESIKKEWEKTMDCVGDIVILADNNGRIKRCNKTFKEFIGKSYEDILGKDWKELLFIGEVEAGAFYGQRTEYLHKPNNRWYVITSYPFVDSSKNEIAGTAIMIHDSTEIKMMTSELEKKNRELEDAYSELKAAQSRILQQEKMASIGQLAAGVAHEINNPIGFISSNLGTLDKYISRLTDFIGAQSKAIEQFDRTKNLIEEIDEKKRQLKLDYIIPDIKQLIAESLDGTQRVKSIVNDLKSFSRMDETEHRLADINSGLDSTINIVWNEIKYKAVLKKEYGNIPLTRCNLGQLNQVFMNMLVNAAHAIEKQGEITVKTWDNGDSIYISISDTGCGIPQDKLNDIFEPFFTTKELGKGTGLGLSIAYNIIKKHNGDIKVDSKLGEGTTFTLRIPVVD